MLRSEQSVNYSIASADGSMQAENITANGGFDAATRTLRHVTIVKYTAAGPHRGEPEILVYCDRAEAHDDRGLQWKYYDGYFVTTGVDVKTGKIEDSIRNDFKELATLPHGAAIGKPFDEVLNVDVERHEPPELSAIAR